MYFLQHLRSCLSGTFNCSTADRAFTLHLCTLKYYLTQLPPIHHSSEFLYLHVSSLRAAINMHGTYYPEKPILSETREVLTIQQMGALNANTEVTVLFAIATLFTRISFHFS